MRARKMLNLSVFVFYLSIYSSFCQGGIVIEQETREINSVYVNYASETLIEPSPHSQINNVHFYHLSIDAGEGCEAPSDPVLSALDYDNLFIGVKRIDAVSRCSYFSEYARKIQEKYPKVTGVIVGLGYNGDPGYFSFNRYESLSEDTNDIRLHPFEVETSDFDLLLTLSADVNAKSQNNSEYLTFNISASTNRWAEMYSHQGFEAYRYIFLSLYTLVLTYGLVRAALLIYQIFTSKRSLSQILASLLLTCLFCVLRLINFAYDPFFVTSLQVLVTKYILFYVTSWIGFVTFTIISLMFVNISKVTGESFFWKYRYVYWFFVTLLLPISITCTLLSYIKGNTIAGLFLGIYISFLTLFESVVIINYGRQVLKLFKITSYQDSSIKNETRKRVSIMIISSGSLFLALLVISVSLSIIDVIGRRTRATSFIPAAMLEVCFVLISFLFISTAYSFSKKEMKSSSVSSQTKETNDMTIS